MSSIFLILIILLLGWFKISHGTSVIFKTGSSTINLATQFYEAIVSDVPTQVTNNTSTTSTFESVIERLLRQQHVPLDFTHRDSYSMKMVESILDYISKDVVKSILQLKLKLQKDSDVDHITIVKRVFTLDLEYRVFSFTFSDGVSKIFLEFVLQYAQAPCNRFHSITSALVKNISAQHVLDIFDTTIESYNAKSSILPFISIDVGSNLDRQRRYTEQMEIFFRKFRFFEHDATDKCSDFFTILMNLPDISVVMDIIYYVALRIDFQYFLSDISDSKSLSKLIKLGSDETFLNRISYLFLQEQIVTVVNNSQYIAYGSILAALKDSNDGKEYSRFITDCNNNCSSEISAILKEYEKYQKTLESALICNDFINIFASNDANRINKLNLSLKYLSGDHFKYLVKHDPNTVNDTNQTIIQVFNQEQDASFQFVPKFQALVSAVQFCFENIESSYESFFIIICNVIRFFHKFIDGSASSCETIKANRILLENDCLDFIQINLLKLIPKRLLPENYNKFSSILGFYRAVSDDYLMKMYLLFTIHLRFYQSISLFKDFISFTKSQNIFIIEHLVDYLQYELKKLETCPDTGKYIRTKYFSQILTILKDEQIFSKTELDILKTMFH